jgi:hypothetical protein
MTPKQLKDFKEKGYKPPPEYIRFLFESCVRKMEQKPSKYLSGQWELIEMHNNIVDLEYLAKEFKKNEWETNIIKNSLYIRTST